MTTPLIGRNVRVEIGKTEGAPKTVTAVSLANPGIASSTAHALLDGSAGYFNAVSGMVNLEGQAARVDTVLTDSFALQNINTTNYPAFTAGTFVPVTAWSTVSRAASYDIGGGAADPIDTTVLLDSIKQNANGLLDAQTVKIDLKLDTTDDEALGLVRAAALSQAYLVFRITRRSASATAAAAPSASSASHSTIAQVVNPHAARASSITGIWSSSTGSIPALVL